MSQKVSESDLAAAAAAQAAADEYILNTPELWGENHFPLPPDMPPDPYSEEKVSNESQPPQLIHQSNTPIDSIEQKTEYPKLYIEKIDSTILAIDYNEDDTIQKVKQKISDITGYDSGDMRLISPLHGWLNGARTLKSYGIKEGEVIHLIRRLREGGRRRKRKTRKRRKKRTKKRGKSRNKKTNKKRRKRKTKRRR